MANKPRKFNRTTLRSNLQMYVNAAVEIAIEEQKKGILPEYGVFPHLLIKALEEISARKGQQLEWRCDNCGEEGCECYNCRECGEHQDDCECEE